MPLSSGDLGGEGPSDADDAFKEEGFLLRVGEPARDLTKTGDVLNL